jgi:hypothetical protein
MKTCKECLYFEVCAFRYKTLCKGTKVEDLIHDCTKFKDRSKYVEVVRCKDCKYKRHNKDVDVILCNHDIGVRGLLKPDDFCSYGERRTNGN